MNDEQHDMTPYDIIKVEQLRNIHGNCSRNDAVKRPIVQSYVFKRKQYGNYQRCNNDLDLHVVECN